MNRTILFLFLVVGLAGANADTVRVRSQTVDLTAVVEWLRTQEGDRPMPHWRAVRIDSLLTRAWGGFRVAASINGEPTREIIIQNIPPALAKRLEHDRATSMAMEEIKTGIDQIETLNRELDVELDLALHTAGVAYDILMSQRAANNLAILELRLSHDRIEASLQMTEELKQSRLLAHFTGQTVGDIEVWDCGLGASLHPPTSRDEESSPRSGR